MLLCHVLQHRTWCLVGLMTCLTSLGCWAPLHSRAVPASQLSDVYRTPIRTAGAPLNFATLTAEPPSDYILGTNDVIDVTVPGLYQGAEIRPMRTQVMASGEIQLPMIRPVRIGGLNLLQAQRIITDAYADGILVDPRVSMTLVQKSSVSVLVLGEVVNPGMYELPKYQNDVGHALAAAGGFNEDAADEIEVHRRISRVPSNGVKRLPGFFEPELIEEEGQDPKTIMRIPLRGLPPGVVEQSDVLLQAGDVVVVPSRRHEVFFVVGKLSNTNLVRFTLGDRERELGAGLILPRDRDIDVVTAVAMAGYIDPIDSPTTVTVHRTMPDGRPFLIKVDLIRARYDQRETVLVQAGDIIYLNPDSAWWFRRTFDRVIVDLIVLPYAKLIGR